MNNYNFKVVAELKSDLTNIQHETALKAIEELQRKFEIIKIDTTTYCKAGKINGIDDFGAVTFFYCMLKKMGDFFNKLEYYDLSEGEKDVAV